MTIFFKLTQRLRRFLWGVYDTSYYPPEIFLLHAISKSPGAPLGNSVPADLETVAFRSLRMRRDCIMRDPDWGNRGRNDSETQRDFSRGKGLLREILVGSPEESVFKYVDQNLHRGEVSAYDRSERVVNTLLILDAMACHKRTRNSLELLIKSDLRYLLDNIEYLYSGNHNNHVLNNYRAILLASLYLSYPPGVRLAIRGLEREIPRMFDCDGWLRECSISYQLVVASWLIDLVDHLSGELQAKILKVIKATYEFLRFFDDCDQLPAIGDVTPDWPWSLLRTYVYSAAAWHCSAPSFSPLSRAFGPFRCLRFGGWRICYRELNDSDNIQHGHLDVGTLWVAFWNLPLFVDFGTDTYDSDARFGPDRHSFQLMASGQSARVEKREGARLLAPIIESAIREKSIVLSLISPLSDNQKVEVLISRNKLRITNWGLRHKFLMTSSFLVNSSSQHLAGDLRGEVTLSSPFSCNQSQYYYDYGVSLPCTEIEMDLGSVFELRINV